MRRGVRLQGDFVVFRSTHMEDLKSLIATALETRIVLDEGPFSQSKDSCTGIGPALLVEPARCVWSRVVVVKGDNDVVFIR